MIILENTYTKVTREWYKNSIIIKKKSPKICRLMAFYRIILYSNSIKSDLHLLSEL